MPIKPILLNHFKTYFTFSKGERNGIIFLLIILAIFIVAIKMTPAINQDKSPEDFIAIQKQVDSLFLNDSVNSAKPIKINYYSKNIKKTPKQENKVLLELNGSDSSALTTLSGIGPVFASRIIKYRNLLGGYYHVNQLKEVYGIKEENLSKALSQITVNISLIKVLSVDTANFKMLARHPYIGKEKAWKIINLRDKSKTGSISYDDLENSRIFDSIQWQRVNHYLFSKIAK